MEAISLDYLARKIQNGDPEKMLVLDTRPFMCFNEAHVEGSVNVHLPPIVKRRSGGFVALENIVPRASERDALIAGKYSEVIVYDQNTSDLCLAEKDSNLYVILQSLKQQVERTHVVYLTGGFTAFRSAYPSLVVCPKSTPQVLSASLFTLSLPSVTPNNSGPVEILPHLYLGDARHAADHDLLTRLSFTAILNVSTSCENHFESDFRYMKIPVQDNSSADLLSWFHKAIDFIDSVRTSGGKVLVHCHAGISRSATICLAYLMSTNNLALEHAYEHVRQRRSVIDPNLNFMRQLKDFESELGTARVRRSSITGQDCTPITPSSVECGLSCHTFTFPVPAQCAPLVSPS
ncbi:dual specificity protein phosphatase 1-B-like [Haliotis rubra]|uniref:dual specificity protein phosphatase 1-B-like n=1 Tax=Haliotis rubra TaxID=36100 RepID=UPI001EE50C09|nr:dual specificity protein phosphatase 1-B-like [Haliotis rubra]